jgi:uncharacterized membrane protein (UPF0182 family)
VSMRSPLPTVSRRGRRVFVAVVGTLLLVSLLSTGVGMYADWLWFGEVGYRDVYAEVLRTRVLLFVLFGLGMAAIVSANVVVAYRMRPAYPPMSPEQQGLERYRAVVTPRIRIAISVIALIVGLVAGISAQGQWRTWMLFANSTPFGVKDPEFGVDASFYTFEYPFWRYLLSAGFTAVLLSVLAALFVHYLYGGVRLQGAGERMTVAARAHLAVLLGLFVSLKAAAYYLDRYGLLAGYNDNTNTVGASYTDVNALLPAKNILLWVAVICAVVFFVSIAVRNVLLPGVALALLGLSAVLVGGVYPAVVEQFTVKPNAADREQEYIERNIKATRYAYGIDEIDREQYNATTTASLGEVRADTGTVPNVRLLDPSQLSRTYAQRRQVRGFYDFNPRLDVDRYTVDGQERDYVVGVRELNTRELSGNQTNWLNAHTTYTHGYGFVAAPANTVDGNGEPVFVSGALDEPRAGQYGDNGAFAKAAGIKQPRVYYGELITDYSVVGKDKSKDKDRELDRPAGEGQDTEQINTTYDGRGGVPVGSFGRRLVYALYFREANFLLSRVFNEHSKVIYVRDPRQRVERVAPFLKLDGDPYPAVVDGRIQWIVDGYTTSNNFPYAQRQTLREAAADSQTGTGTAAQPREQINYLRNSVKATVDAYDGTVKLYGIDSDDPVLKTWNKAFGGVIKPKSEIPDELASHFRYPEDVFKVQREILAQYHVGDPQEFFSNQDFWNVPKDPTIAGDGANKGDQPPFYVLAKFPGQDEATFQLTTALTARGKDNLAALVSASSAPADYGRIRVLELPGDTPIEGPNQVQSRMTSPSQVQDALRAFSSNNSRPTYGNLLTLPVGGGLLYVEPLYVKTAGDSAYPQVRKVFAAFGNRTAYADNLTDALDQLFGEGTANTAPTPPSTGQPQNPTTPPSAAPVNPEVAAAVAAMNKAISDLRTAQQRGDFAGIGKAQGDLAAAIERFEKAQQAAAATPNANPSATPRPSPSGTPSPTVPSPGG